MNDRPTVKYINKYIKERVCAAGPDVWLDLGVELLQEKDVPALQMIKSDKTDCSGRCSEMFKLWLQRQPQASWGLLIKALYEIRMDTLAFDIMKMFSVEKPIQQTATVDQKIPYVGMRN